MRKFKHLVQTMIIIIIIFFLLTFPWILIKCEKSMTKFYSIQVNGALV